MHKSEEYVDEKKEMDYINEKAQSEDNSELFLRKDDIKHTLESNDMQLDSLLEESCSECAHANQNNFEGYDPDLDRESFRINNPLPEVVPKECPQILHEDHLDYLDDSKLQHVSDHGNHFKQLVYIY